MKKKIISLLTTLVMVVSLVGVMPVSAYTQLVNNSNVAYPVNDGYIYFDASTGKITGCSRDVTVANIPSSINGVPVTSIGRLAFNECYDLSSVSIPNSVTTIEQGAFNNCSNLSNVNFGGNVQQIGWGAFTSCDSLVSIDLPESVSYIGGDAFGYCTSLSQITIPQKVKSIENRTFQYCSTLTSITIPSTITNIGVEAFWHCDNLISISIPGSVTEIGGKAFAGCDNLCNVTINNGVQSLGTEAFASCPKLKSIILPNSLTSTGPMTFEGSGLTNVEIQDGIEKIGNGSFTYCSNLQSVAIPNSVIEIGREAFLGCDSLKQINIPDSVSTIGRQAFHGCDSLESVRLPNGITGIGNFTLADCGNLKTVFIPKSVKGIGMYAFRGCYNLQDVYYSGTEEEWLQISWHEDSGKGNFTNANIHYNSTSDFVIPFSQLYFIEPIVILDIGKGKTLSVHSRDVANVNGELVYSNDKVVNASDIDWNAELYEDSGIIKIDDNGQITGLSEGYEHILINSKNDLDLSTFCHVYVGDPNELHYTSTYDTKQYYAEGGFFSEVSSISDCVEIYILIENKLKEAVANISGIDETIAKDTGKETFKDIKPITLTASVDGTGLSFDRDTYQNTYTITLDAISLAQAVDDILMLFPYNLNVASSGNNYTVTVTLESESFETITDEYSFTVENLETKSANEHIDFVSSNKDYKVSKQNIYGETMVTLKNDAEYKWSKYSTFDFENYYEVVFADILIELMNTSQLGNVSLLPVVKEWIGNYKTILSEVSTIVEDDYTGYLNVTENAIDKVLKKSKYTTEGMEVHDEIRDLVVLKLRDEVSIDKVNSAFAAIDKTQQYFSFFELSLDITNDIADFIDGVSVLNAYKEMDDEFKAVIQNLYNQIPSSEVKLKDAVYHYVNVDSYLGYSSEMLNEVRNMAGDITLDVFNTVYKKQVLSSICKSIGNIQLKSGALFSSTAVFSGISTAIGSFTTGVQLGLCISDILCDSSGKSEEMSKVVAMSEFSPYVINTLNHYESKLYSERNDDAVTHFEYAFAMHKATQSYIMQHTINSLEIKRDSLIIKLFGRDDYDSLISDILAYKKSVENLKCHNTNSADIPITGVTINKIDINSDGNISTADVGLINAHAKGTKQLSGEALEKADVNKDGKVSTADVGLINAYAKGTKKYS